MTIAPLFVAWGAGIPTTDDIDTMISWGARGVRFPIAWDSGDPTFAGTYVENKKLSSIIDYCNNATLKDGTPGFGVLLQSALGATYAGQAYNHSCGGLNVPVTFAAFQVALGTFYADALYALELGPNEPNHAKADANASTAAGGPSGVTARQKGGRYLEILANVYPALKAAAPGLTIVNAGLGGINNNFTDVAATLFVGDIYKASVTVGATTYHGMAGLRDADNFHPYTYPETWTQDVTVNKDRGATNMLATRAVIVANGDTAVPMWVTEFGTPAPFGKLGVDDAADIFTDGYASYNALAYGGGAGGVFCYFAGFDNGHDPSIQDDHFGLVTDTGALKRNTFTVPSMLNAFKNAAAGYTGPASSGSWQWGICVAASVSHSDHIAANVAQAWVDAGVGEQPVVRVDCQWPSFQDFTGVNLTTTKPGQYDTCDFTNIDAVLSEHQAAGNLALIIFDYTPGGLGGTFGAGGNFGHVFPNRDAINGYRDAANGFYLLVDHIETTFPGLAVGYEFQNEPNGGVFLNPTSATNFWAMFICAAKTLKTGVIQARAGTRAVYDVTVAPGGCAPVKPGTANATDQWFQTGIDLGAGPYIGAATIHLYGLQCAPTNPASWNQRKFVLPQLRQVLDNAGLTALEIWISEDGCPHRPVATPTNTGDTANCGTFGSNPDPQKFEITETEAAARIAELAAWYVANRKKMKLKLFYYEHDCTVDNTHAGDWANHAGIRAYSTSFNGAAITAIYNAFTAALVTVGAGTRTAPSCMITAPADDPTFATPQAGDVVVLIGTVDAVDDPDKLDVKLSTDSGATFPNDATYSSQYGWYFILTKGSLGDGHYTLVAESTNTASQTTPSAAVHIDIVNGSALPTITGVSPNSGTTAGGTPITITGTGFKPGGVAASAVKIGGTNVASFTVVDDTTITATTPAEAAATKNVKVTTTQGISAVSAGDKFTFTSGGGGGIPTVTDVSPPSGTPAGGTPIVVTGTGFTGVTGVTFGGVAATDVSVDSTTSITCTAPAGSSGDVDVIVTNGVGPSVTAPADVYTYNNPPVVTIDSFTGISGNTHTFPGTFLVKQDGQVTLHLTVVDDLDSNVAPLVYGGGQLIGRATATGVATKYDITFDIAILPNGVDDLTATATDSDGAVGTFP